MNNKELFKIIGGVDGRLIEEADNPVRRRNTRPYVRWGAIAAGIVLVLGLSINMFPDKPQSATTPQITKQAPAASPNGIRKFLNYNGYRYAFVDDGAPFKFSGDEPSKSLGALEFDLKRDIEKNEPAINAAKDYATTFAFGGKLYEIPSYPSHFRIAVQYEHQFYLAEIVAKVDDTAITAAEYLEISNLKVQVQDFHILNHMGNDVLKKVTTRTSVNAVIDGLYDATNAHLTNKEYEAIADAQSKGKSYLLKFNLKDGTHMNMYMIPELNIVSMGDSYYRLPGMFMNQSGDLFEKLKQEPLPQS